MKSVWDEIKPTSEEYGNYYQGYVDQVGAGNIIDILMDQMQETCALINSLSHEQAHYRYAEDKWTVKEVIGHLMDTEHVFACRALCFSRNDPNTLPGFDQDEYVKAGNFNSRSRENLENEYFALRNSTIYLFSSFSEEMLMRKGIANNVTFTVRAIPFIIAGHERHHLEILKTRYGVPVAR